MSGPADSRTPNDLQRLLEELEQAKADADAALDNARKQLGTIRWEEFQPDADEAPMRSEEDDDY